MLYEGLPIQPRSAESTSHAGIKSAPEISALWVTKHPDRKGAGLFLTPPGVARHLVSAATRHNFRPRSVLDPSVGGGVFLAEALARFGPDVELFGVDNDPTAVALTRLTLWLAAARSGHPFVDPRPLIDRIRCADALLDLDTWKTLQPSRGFDLVCGNPPFGNAIEKRTARTSRQKGVLKAAFPESACGPYDRSVLFVQLSAQMLAKGGRLALLLPRALLSARYAEGLRKWLARTVPLLEVVCYPKDAPIPDAQIAMVGWIAGREVGSGDVRIVSSEERRARRLSREVLRAETWGALLHPFAERLEGSAREHPTIGDLFKVRSGASVAEAYEIVEHLRDGGTGWRFLTAGLLTRYGDRWGQKTGRHLGRRFLRPVLPFGAPAVSASRHALYAGPKVVVAGLSRILKARCDADGGYAAGVGTFLVVPRETGANGQRLLRRGALMLNSAYLSEVHRSRYGPMCLSGGNLPLGRSNIEAFPVPACLARQGAPITHRTMEPYLNSASSSLPDEEPFLLALLDEAYARLSSSYDAAWDLLAQRAILALMGCREVTASDTLCAWSRRLGQSSSALPDFCSTLEESSKKMEV